jgi:chitin synthase
MVQVDADTKVYPESLKHLVNCMHNDQMIMGVCGETRIANKRQSWVTAIQVFEYFISHHMAKAFESVFGGVSCLPGCFSMFRLKARKVTGDDWIPLIIKPEIVKEYSQSDVVSLHQKNLLLLGEDRFLTTILIRTFPNRKMMFLPQAKCRTVVPDTFPVLLSQRRRWINSTIHNLMELVLVRNLCGTFCFSMQFVVFMDLLGTVVLPVAIVLTYILIVGVILSPPRSFEEAIPVLLLGAVLGLPAVLILITTRKVVYVFWMLIYLLALPVWNLIPPCIRVWHFDDFSWGETRQVVRARFGHDTNPLSTEKLKAKPKGMHMVMDRQSFNPSVFLYEDGKIGSARGCASLSERRRGEETSRECIPSDISLEKDTSRPDTR